MIDGSVAGFRPCASYALFNGVKATPHNSARAICEQILLPNEAHWRSNTLCIARQCNEMREENFRKAPQTTLCGVALNPSPLPSDLRAAHCHPPELPFLQNFRQLTAAHSACMCHNLFAVIWLSHFHFTTSKKPRRPFRAPRLLVFSGPFCYSSFCFFEVSLNWLFLNEEKT